jgi:hypothetical protein
MLVYAFSVVSLFKADIMSLVPAGTKYKERSEKL